MQAVVQQRPLGYTPRRDSGLAGYERVLSRAGLAPVAGVDEAGRGACAGPLVVASAILKPSRSAAVTGIPGLADSKALTAQIREEIYGQIVNSALDWSVVIIPPADIDRVGLHVCNVSGMRRALAGLSSKPGYVLTDGFPVRGLGVPALAMWKGDQVAACVAAASIIAKVTRDRIMSELHTDHPSYGFARHKGYSTASHMKALAEHGPCPEHRRSFVNVGGVVRTRDATAAALAAADSQAAEEAAGGAEQVGDPSSLAASPCHEPADGQNGPIVDLAGDYAWSAASLASGARGA
ncbi:MAG: ribonuclease HII [Streptosporangiaceae bacterium]